RRHTRCLSDWSSDVCSSDLARLDPAIDLELVDLDFENARDAVQPLEGRDDFEQVLLLVDADEKVRRDGVRELAGVVHADGGDHRSEERRVGKEWRGWCVRGQ